MGSNLELTTYEGKKVLAWWQGTVTEAAYGEGEGIIANTSYEPIAHIPTGNGYQADIHELNITPAGDGVPRDLQAGLLARLQRSEPAGRGLGRSGDRHQDRLVIWEWHALGTRADADTEVIPAGGVFDPFHVNSVQALNGNRLLVSLRDISAIYDIEQDGSIAVGARRQEKLVLARPSRSLLLPARRAP